VNMSFISQLDYEKESSACTTSDTDNLGDEKDLRRPHQDLLTHYMSSLASFLQDIATQSSGWSLWSSTSHSLPQWRQILDGPALLEVEVEEQHDLLARKLDRCSVLLSFSIHDEQADRDIEQKTAQLEEILDFVTHNFSQCNKSMLIDIVSMVKKNIVRVLPPENLFHKHEDEENDLYEEPSWPHLRLVYEIFLKILENPHFEPNSLKTVINRTLLTQIFQLFESSDSRERDNLKTTLHRIYGNFLMLRSFIRDSISNLCLCFLEHQRPVVGISEVLEVLGAIIKGLSSPLKLEHRSFLEKVLIPLHKSGDLASFSGALSYCDLQMVTKDPSILNQLLEGLLRLWPQRDRPKEVYFVAEIQALLELSRRTDIEQFSQKIFLRVSQAVISKNYQVSQKALEMWESSSFTEIIKHNPDVSQKILGPSLIRASTDHWQPMVNAMADAVIDIMEDLIPHDANNSILKRGHR